ncbi:MAG TPA: hypothetical protein DEP27_07475 [Ruminococcaceae bacterium]|jgi:sortase B|nr:hypothetical protein [Oscillospiraceae bacterium]
MYRSHGKKKKFSFKEKLLLLFFFIIFAASVTWLIVYRVNAAENEAQMAALRASALSSSQVPSSSTPLPSSQVKSAAASSASSAVSSAVRAFPQLQAKNSDIKAWIQIEGTAVNYPVMQTPKEPEYYLHRNLAKQAESRGLPFLDVKSDLKKSKNYLVYGHNMRDGTAFAGLLGYLDKSFCKKHPIIHFDTQNGTGDYQVIAEFRSKIYRTDSKAFKYYQYADIETKNHFDTYIKNVKKRADYDTGLTASYGEQLLTLSTCYQFVKNGRLVIVAKKVK